MCTEAAAKQTVYELQKSKFIGMHKFILSAFESIGLKIRDTTNNTSDEKRKRCMITECKDHKKYKGKCEECGINVCFLHSQITCISCKQRLDNYLS